MTQVAHISYTTDLDPGAPVQSPQAIHGMAVFSRPMVKDPVVQTMAKAVFYVAAAGLMTAGRFADAGTGRLAAAAALD
jgi:hypothetical protein